ncbi:hypothetical protein [Hoylesella timonensis]|nr:hypothetical protein [Hoylesella timonensis]
MNKIYCPYPPQPFTPWHPFVAIYTVPPYISVAYKQKKASSIG